MINNIRNSYIIVIHLVINMGVSFMKNHHEYKNILIYEEKIGEVSWKDNRVVPNVVWSRRTELT